MSRRNKHWSVILWDAGAICFYVLLVCGLIAAVTKTVRGEEVRDDTGWKHIPGATSAPTHFVPTHQPLRGIIRGALPHALIVGVDGVREELQAQGSRFQVPGPQPETLNLKHETSLWTWSTPNQPHHAAVVRVHNRVDGSAGSGVYCQLGGRAGVLTCAHLNPREKLEVTFADGTTQEGAATVDRYKHDISFVFVTHPTLTPAPIAASDVQPGEQVEFATYGGPSAKFRHFLGPVVATGDCIEVATPVTHGDSGAPLFNARGEVIGIQSVGVGGTVATGQGFSVYRSGGAVGLTPITAFVTRCWGGQCQPQSPAYQSPAGGGVQFYPPAAGPQQKPQPGPQPYSPPAAPAPVVDHAAIADLVSQQLLAEIRAGRVPEIKGADGRDGRDGNDGRDADAAAIDLDTIADRVRQRIAGEIHYEFIPDK
jgi:hypothetical protein